MNEPHFFLTEDDLDELETWRGMVGADRRQAETYLEKLRNKVGDDREALAHIEMVAAAMRGLHTFLVAALDARTAELTDEATGYERDA